MPSSFAWQPGAVLIFAPFITAVDAVRRLTPLFAVEMGTWIDPLFDDKPPAWPPDIATIAEGLGTGITGLRVVTAFTALVMWGIASLMLSRVHVDAADIRGEDVTKKPTWVVEKERARRVAAAETLWLFGLHAVRDALMNPAREKLRLVVTKNAADKLGAAIAVGGIAPELADARKFPAPLDAGSVHQGAALEVKPLRWGSLAEMCAGPAPVVLLDRVTDPHNVGAILRSAEVFGAAAVIAPARSSAPETGALAKTASGALERQPYLRVRNLAQAMRELQEMGFLLIGLDGTAQVTLADALAGDPNRPVGLVLGAEGPGLREKTRMTCDLMAKIPFARDFGSLNVSNAAAVALYAVQTAR